LKPAKALVMVFSIFIASFFQSQVSAQTSRLNVGHWAKYSVIASWKSEDPNATMPTYWKELMNIKWETVTVFRISGTNITILLTTIFKDATQKNDTYWGDVTTSVGQDEFGFRIIAAGLSKGDTVRQSMLSINYTTSKEFAGENREVNYAGLSIKAEGVTLYEYYWDRSTGILCASFMTDMFLQEGYVTTTLLQKKIVETNLWQVQTASSDPWMQWGASIIIVTIVIVATITFLLIRTKPKPKKKGRKRS